MNTPAAFLRATRHSNDAGSFCSRRRWLIAIATILQSSALSRAREFKSGAPESCLRLYTVHAAVTFLGATLLTRRRAGWGRASVAASADGLMLEFAAGSDPARAAGLNRVGVIEEQLKFEPDGSVETSYFGLMTASPEESLSDARKALARPSDAGTFLAAEGRAKGGRTACAIHRIRVDENFTWSRHDRFLAAAKEAAASKRYLVRNMEGETPPGVKGGALSAFLAAFDSSEPAARIIFDYNSCRYELITRRSGQRGENRIPVDRIDGWIRNLATGKRTGFCVWTESQGSKSVPVRIEYQARPYLRLIFEEVSPHQPHS